MARNRVEVLKNRKGKWYWRTKAGNGEITSVAQAYSKKGNAVRAGRQAAKRQRCQCEIKE